MVVTSPISVDEGTVGRLTIMSVSMPIPWKYEKPTSIVDSEPWPAHHYLESGRGFVIPRWVPWQAHHHFELVREFGIPWLVDGWWVDGWTKDWWMKDGWRRIGDRGGGWNIKRRREKEEGRKDGRWQTKRLRVQNDSMSHARLLGYLFSLSSYSSSTS